MNSEHRKFSNPDVIVISDDQVEYLAPIAEVEKKLTQIWREILGIERIGLNQNFFDLGGNSIQMDLIRQQVQSAFTREIPIMDLMKYPTISSLAQYLSRMVVNEPAWDEVLKRADIQKEVLEQLRSKLKRR